MKTTHRHFSLFKQECERWIDPLGLSGWEFHFMWEKQEDLATIDYDHKAKYAVITFTKDWLDDVIKLTTKAIKRTAFHEMWELKLNKLKGKEEDKHDIIYTLEKLLCL